MELVTALLTKEFVIAACSVAVNIALWRAFQKEREEHLATLRRSHEGDMKYLDTLRDLKEIMSGVKTEIAMQREAQRDADRRRGGD